MTRVDLVKYILASDILHQWHWFGPQFAPLQSGQETPFAASIIDTALQLGNLHKLAPRHYINRLAGFSGKENNPRQYEQLMQVLAEMLVLNHIIHFHWGKPVEFTWEPGSNHSPKGPEINVRLKNLQLGIEVKSPSFQRHENPNALEAIRQTAPEIDAARGFNPMENYLISANEKFKEFKREQPRYISLLFVVWDDRIHEAIAALLHPDFGIFQRRPAPYPYVDGVIVSQHRAHFEALLKGEPSPFDYDHLLEYGREKTEPWKIFIPNPESTGKVPDEIVDCFQIVAPGPALGDRYDPANRIPWRKFDV